MKYWGYIAEQNVAPIWIGEFGTGLKPSDAIDQAPGSQGQWFSALTDFLASHPSIQWSYWALNGEDRYGLLKKDYSSAYLQTPRLEELERLLNNRKVSSSLDPMIRRPLLGSIPIGGAWR